ncbi:histidine kinase [Thermosipho melanesiensis]|uniref:histidine kinase n=2 Tax=Thermosipho melanesiensis TaxID=46541 RepID=A6LP23_THEM4|nr:ATP-binding protein [Thermosipho melanesiensis]ABR31674.1 PAS/PAC sensor signal transduction histidine kinase [Thermosipho melanesiensis BI429]APT74701.1 histidine kinase [Thermosipho melanesiensis]OOC35198.1 histidine kinase [Thermosipho melanesiensis]OOC35408.1 histidine kinase [Thermosipho melanesiensis]OOC36659.1 histidine kinase [Thermosipho melanesiensis]
MVYLFLVIAVLIAINITILNTFRKLKKNCNILNLSLKKIKESLGEDPNSPPLYVSEKIRKKIVSLEENIYELELSLKNHLTILNNIVDPIIISKKDGTITFANMEARNITRPGVEGRKLYEVFEDYYVNQMFEEAQNKKEITSGEINLFVNGEKKYYELKIVPVTLEQNNERYIIILHDVTQERILENARKEFISNVSHELRTPLTSIHGYAEALLEDNLDDKELIRRFLTIIESEAARMTRLINDLLDLEKLESGNTQFIFEKINFTEILEHVRNIIEPLTKDYNVDVEFVSPDKIELIGDKDRLTQMVLNLVDNAVKYTSLKEKGEKKVLVEAYKDNNHVKLIVKDTGVGIPEKAQKKLFERFYRVDKARSRKMGGTGLGLSIVKTIVEKHNGTIEFTSKEGVGTKFIVTLPVGGIQNESI